MSSLSTVMHHAARGFKTAKGSLYALEEQTNIATRYKADTTKPDAGLQQVMLTGFLDPLQAKQAALFYERDRAFGQPSYAVLSKSVPDDVRNHKFQGWPLFAGLGRDVKILPDFSHAAGEPVHFLARLRQDGRLTNQWFTFGRIEKEPAIGLRPFELNPYMPGLLHMGHKITEVYKDAAELAASIKRHQYPVRIGRHGHLEHISAMNDNGAAPNLAIK